MSHFPSRKMDMYVPVEDVFFSGLWKCRRYILLSVRLKMLIDSGMMAVWHLEYQV